jgi:hypothetical protein
VVLNSLGVLFPSGPCSLQHWACSDCSDCRGDGEAEAEMTGTGTVTVKESQTAAVGEC